MKALNDCNYLCNVLKLVAQLSDQRSSSMEDKSIPESLGQGVQVSFRLYPRHERKSSSFILIVFYLLMVVINC